MWENYLAYRDRIQSLIEQRACFPPENEQLVTADGLKNKFCADGSFHDFYGDTIVFRLSEDTKQFLGEIQTSLYEQAAGILSEKLPVKSFHITLHDLSSSVFQQDIRTEMKTHQDRMPEIMPFLRNKGTVCLKAKGMVSMVSSSIVMLFEPASAEDHDTIQEMYEYIEKICPLPYPLTLLSTLAYYKPGIYAPKQWGKLYQLIDVFNRKYAGKRKFVMDTHMMEYQVFTSMKDYITAY